MWRARSRSPAWRVAATATLAARTAVVACAAFTVPSFGATAVLSADATSAVVSASAVGGTASSASSASSAASAAFRPRRLRFHPLRRGRALGADEWISHPISLALAQSRPISPGALHEGLLERRGGAQPLLWLEFEEPP